MNCLRCQSNMEFLKEYKFDSQDNNRGIFSAIFDIEENLIFKVYVCPKCKHSELIYSGKRTWID